MIQTPSIAELAVALAKAQASMQPALTDSENPHFHSRYASLAAVWEACREPLTTHGLSVLQPVQADGAKVTVTTLLVHSSGEWISEALTVTAQTATPQGIGSAITYGRRYGLAAMVGIAPDDDDGNEASTTVERQDEAPRSTVAPFTPAAKLSTPPAGELRVVKAKVAKEGENAKGPWTLYAVKFSDGREATTFSKSLFKAAEEACHSGVGVTVAIDGKNLTTIEPVYQVNPDEVPF
jgi:hypothetical protein